MRKIRYFVFIVCLIPSAVRADVIYFPYKESGTALSNEGIFSYELPITRLNTLNYWCGFGGVFLINEIKHPAFGTELAIEIRQYFQYETFKKFNIGLYGGLAYMWHPGFYSGHVTGYDSSYGFVPGLKISYKHKFNTWLFGEPYIGISAPRYDNETSLFFTIGLRVGFNKVKIRNE